MTEELEYKVDGNKITFYGIDTFDKRLSLIKAYEKLKQHGTTRQRI